MNEDFPLWLKNASNESISTDVDSLSDTAADVIDNIRRIGVDSIDLSILKEDSINVEHLLTVLRVTYSIRENIIGWNKSLAMAESITRKMNLDSNDLLYGLIPSKYQI